MYTNDKPADIARLSNLLADLTVIMLRIYPELTTVNPVKTGSLPVTGNQYQRLSKLLKMLIHVSTLTNKTYRMKDKGGCYISEKADYINALSLMKDLVSYYHVKKVVYEHELVALIDTHYTDGETFTARDLQELTGFSRSYIKLFVRMLRDRAIIVRAGGNRKSGYLYRLA